MQVLDKKASNKNDRGDDVRTATPISSFFLFVWQVVRFGLVGGANTLLDLFIFNVLFWCHPTRSTGLLLSYNSIAYLFGGINSFLLNKYWTFRRYQKTSRKEIFRFVVTTIAGIICNNFFLWLINSQMPPFVASPQLWANISKVIAIFSTVAISFVGMRLWVFVQHPQSEGVQ